MLLRSILSTAVLFGSAPAESSIQVRAPIAESRFGSAVPPGWQLKGKWTHSPAGARASQGCTASSSFQVPTSCLVEMVFELPSAKKLHKKAAASIFVGTLGNAANQITASAEYQVLAGEKPDCPPDFPYKATLAGTGTGTDGKPATVTTSGDMRPAVLRAWDEPQQHTGWADQTVSLGFAIDEGQCRLLVNGNVVGEIALSQPSERTFSLSADGVTVRAVRVLPSIPQKYTFLGGRGLALHNGGAGDAAAAGVAARRAESAVIEIDGVPFVVQGEDDRRLATLNVDAERHRKGTWSEGTGMPMAALPHRWYSAAHLLLHLGEKDDKTPSMGFGLRVPEMYGGDLKNIYLGEVPVRSCDSGVTVRPVPELGGAWFVVRVPINPAALVRPGSAAYFTRTWTAGGGVPRPHGKPSALSVAACTVEEAGIELSVEGNGLGNVYSELARPWLTGILRNRTEEPVTVSVTTDLIPLQREHSRKRWKLSLSPGQEEKFDALAAPMTNRGHYKVRVVADGGPAGRIDYRTNIGVLVPDTRTRINSPFGCWSRLWTDGSTGQQSNYLKVKAGIGFWMGPHHRDIRMGHEIPDDAAAEAIAKSIRPDVRIFMLGWEHNWSMEQTFAFPRVIAEGQPEELSDEQNERIDKVTEKWRRMARAVRKHRPGVKISLGNSGVNFSVPFLQRGFKPGVEFDYFGTEEGIFWYSPEQPATAIGNVNWWVKAISEHFGFKDVPIFHSESIYFGTGPGFSRMSERSQAGYCVRAYLLGFPYNSVFGFTSAMVDSSNRFIYSNWGTSGYCNQAPDCSPKLSYVSYATLTQLLDAKTYDGRLDTGTTSIYALRFRPLLYALWNLRGERMVTLSLKDKSKLEVVDAINRPAPFSRDGEKVSLTLAELPVYITGTEIIAIEPGPNLEQRLPERTVLSTLENLDDWQLDTEPDRPLEQPDAEWTGVPRAMGRFDVTFQAGMPPPGTSVSRAMTFTQKPLPGKHGLIPRYISLSAKPGQEIRIPRGTTRVGVWMRGNSTWAAVKIGLRDEQGNRRLLDSDAYSRMMDNFDGWRFLETGPLDDANIHDGSSVIDRIVITMPEQQVYVDELLTTPTPQIAIWGLCAMERRPPDVNYLSW